MRQGVDLSKAGMTTEKAKLQVIFVLGGPGSGKGTQVTCRSSAHARTPSQCNVCLCPGQTRLFCSSPLTEHSSACQDEGCMMDVSAVRSQGRAVSRRAFDALCQHLTEVLWLCSA